MDRNTNISIIYCSEDKEAMLHLLRQLGPLQAAYNLTIWQDDPILPGALWKAKSDAFIDQTDIFLLLVSDHFMHSEFIKQLEFKLVIDRYKENKALVLPIILDNCQWDIDFKSDDYDFKLSELEVLPKSGKPIANWETADRAYREIGNRLKQLLHPNTEKSVQQDPITEQEDKETPPQTEEQLALRFSEEAEAKERKQEAQRQKEEKARLRAEEEQRSKEAAVARQKQEEVDRLRKEAKEKRRVEEEKIQREEAALKRRSEEQARKIEESETSKKPKTIESAKSVGEEIEETHQGKSLFSKRRRNIGIAMAALVLAALVVFLVVNPDSEESPTVKPQSESDILRDSTAVEKTKIDSLDAEPALPELSIGQLYKEGIIFSLSEDGKSGKIAHLNDAGPMPWLEAMQIHLDLGAGWRLPTLDEMISMYQTIGQGATNKGEFGDGLYWSATPYDEHQARLLRFRNGNTSYHYNKNSAERNFYVRAIRDFSR